MFGWLNQNRRLNELEEHLRKLVRIVEERDLDWVDMRARCKRLLDRTEKAARALHPEASNGNGEEVTEPEGEQKVEYRGRMLTPHQMSIQQAILKRRAT